MTVQGTFEPPALQERYVNYPVTGEGSLEVTDAVLRVNGRMLGLQWLSSLLGFAGFVLGLVLMFALSGADLPMKVNMILWIGPALGGVIVGHLLGKNLAKKRGAIVRDIPLTRIKSASRSGKGCQIIVKTGWINKQAIWFVPTAAADVDPLIATLFRR